MKTRDQTRSVNKCKYGADFSFVYYLIDLIDFFVKGGTEPDKRSDKHRQVKKWTSVQQQCTFRGLMPFGRSLSCFSSLTLCRVYPAIVFRLLLIEFLLVLADWQNYGQMMVNSANDSQRADSNVTTCVKLPAGWYILTLSERLEVAVVTFRFSELTLACLLSVCVYIYIH